MVKMVLKMLLKRMDLKGFLIEDLLKVIAFKKLEELAKESTNTLDDGIVAIIKPTVEAEAAKFIETKLIALEAKLAEEVVVEAPVA